MTAWLIAFLTLILTGDCFARHDAEESYFQQTDTIQHTQRILKCAADFNRQLHYKIFDNEEDYKLLTGFYEGDGCPGNPEIDFEKEVLIGYPIQYGGCKQPQVDLSLTKVRGKLIAHVYVSNNDPCRGNLNYIFWFTVNKSEPTNSIYFERHRGRTDTK